MPRAASEGGQLLRLAGARQALRRLFPFRRARQPRIESGPEESFSDGSETDGLSVPSVPPNTPSSDYAASLANVEAPTLPIDSDKSLTYSHFGDDDDFETDEFNDSSTLSDGNGNMASRSGAAAGEKRAAKQKRGGKEKRAADEHNAGDQKDVDQDKPKEAQQVDAVVTPSAVSVAVADKDKDKDKQKENQQPRANQVDAATAVDGVAEKVAGTTAAAPAADKDKQKESQKPRGNQIDELSRKLAGIAVAQAAPVAVDKKLETPSEEIDAEVVTDLSTVDPAVLAERAEHQKFMQEALDMVSPVFAFAFFPYSPLSRGC